MVISYSCKGKTTSPSLISRNRSDTVSWVVHHLSSLLVTLQIPSTMGRQQMNSSVPVLWKRVTFKMDKVPSAICSNALIVACCCSISDYNLKYFSQWICSFLIVLPILGLLKKYHGITE